MKLKLQNLTEEVAVKRVTNRLSGESHGFAPRSPTCREYILATVRSILCRLKIGKQLHNYGTDISVQTKYIQ